MFFYAYIINQPHPPRWEYRDFDICHLKHQAALVISGLYAMTPQLWQIRPIDLQISLVHLIEGRLLSLIPSILPTALKIWSKYFSPRIRGQLLPYVDFHQNLIIISSVLGSKKYMTAISTTTFPSHLSTSYRDSRIVHVSEAYKKTVNTRTFTKSIF